MDYIVLSILFLYWSVVRLSVSMHSKESLSIQPDEHVEQLFEYSPKHVLHLSWQSLQTPFIGNSSSEHLVFLQRLPGGQMEGGLQFVQDSSFSQVLHAKGHFMQSISIFQMAILMFLLVDFIQRERDFFFILVVYKILFFFCFFFF